MGTRIAIGTAGVLMAVIGLIAIIGHLTGRPALYEWGFHDGDDGMPINSAVCFLLTGASIYRIALTFRLRKDA